LVGGISNPPAKSYAQTLRTKTAAPGRFLKVCSAALRRANIGRVTAAELWRRGQVGWPRRFPIVQFPNPPLLLAFAGWGVADATTDTAHDVGIAVFTISLAVWAWEEATDGVNWFRRLLGAGALVWIVVRLAGEL
jgi:hypothetical protein